jgi:hypothetical protein
MNVISHKKIVARMLAKKHLCRLQNRVAGLLVDQGFFRDSLEVQLQDNLVPWLMDLAASELINRNELEEYSLSMVT